MKKHYRFSLSLILAFIATYFIMAWGIFDWSWWKQIPTDGELRGWGLCLTIVLTLLFYTIIDR